MTEFPKRTLEFKYQVNEPNQNIDSLSINYIIHIVYLILLIIYKIYRFRRWLPKSNGYRDA